MDEERIAQIRGEWMQEVVKLLYGRMNRLNEILRLTREICSALDRNDRVSVRMLMEMRGEEMEAVDEGLRKLHVLEEQMPQELRSEIRGLLSGRADEQEEDGALRIAELSRNCKSVLIQPIDLDRRMSRRIAGSDSYYDN